MTIHKDIFLLLGSNLGDREKNLLVAIKKINGRAGAVVHVSSVYETQPWGIAEQPLFLNQVIAIESAFAPGPLLANLHSIEKELGRKRTIHWGPRTIDIDILFFGNEVVNEPDLVIPHPGMPERRFTLIPLCEIVPNFIHPGLYKTCRQLLLECSDPLTVKLFGPANP